MSTVIFTLGYERRTLPDVVELLESAGAAAVVDVRETAWSHKPGFSKSALDAGLAAAGLRYFHAPFAGNPRWIRETAADPRECIASFRRYLTVVPEVVDAFADLMEFLNPDSPIALICFERDPHTCHRTIIAESWASGQDGRAVVHLGTDD